MLCVKNKQLILLFEVLIALDLVHPIFPRCIHLTSSHHTFSYLLISSHISRLISSHLISSHHILFIHCWFQQGMESMGSLPLRLPKSTSKVREWTSDEVAKHNQLNDCFVIIHGRVYDVTKYLNQRMFCKGGGGGGEGRVCYIVHGG